jgi:CheY-like chemotaxis protein
MKRGRQRRVFRPALGGHHVQGNPMRSKEVVPVVVVEDDADARETLKAILEANGYAVRTAVDATEAPRIIEAFNPVCVMLDLGLPEADSGLQRARTLHARFGPTLIIIVVTGNTSPEVLQAAQAAGADYVLTKPIEVERLNTLLLPVR